MSQRTLSTGQKADLELVRSSGLFDEEFYLATYPDVAASDIDPATHFVLSGSREGRDPSAEFSTKAYADRYPDALRSGHEPLIHYLRLGKAEGRSLNPMRDDIELIVESRLFDEDYYRHVRPDLPDDQEPVEHYLLHGGFEGFDPSEGFSSSTYMRQYEDVIVSGLNPLVHYLRHGRPEGRQIQRGRPLRPEFRTLYETRWQELNPFPVVRVRGAGPRITVVTDSVGAGSLFGGVGTALILATLLANRHGATLRIATRNEPPDAGLLLPLQQATGVVLAGQLEIVHLPTDGSQPLLMADQELVITTSWWTTRAALDSTLRREELAYLLQEDERMFYPYGDERLLCEETLSERDLTVVVNTQRLLDHLLGTLPHLASSAVSFEPAFPGGEPPAESDGRRRFFFYSRPENARNLFWRGGQALSRAIEDNILDPDVWSFHFVGRKTPDLVLPRAVRPHVAEGLDWRDYQALVSTMDAALVLMDTPHPSYPPLDLAAAGAAVLTNRHPGKEDLSDLSANILIADPALDSLVDGLTRVAALGVDDARRRENREHDHLERDWAVALTGALDALDARSGARLGRGGHVH